MPRNNEEIKATVLIAYIMIFLIQGISCYIQFIPLLHKANINYYYIDLAIKPVYPFFKDMFYMKLISLFFIVCSSLLRTGKKVETEWKDIFAYSAVGSGVFLLTPKNPYLFTFTTLFGLFLATYGISLLIRKLKDNEIPDEDEGFLQNEELITDQYSINIPYKYIYQKKYHNGWINCINPFRASMVLGSPGSGKSFAIYNAFIEQCIRKGYTMFLYDYKFPDLTERVITEIAYQAQNEGLWKNMEIKPNLYIINFDDPLKSNRSNPIHHSYITDPSDTTEIADLVFKNINKGSDGKGFDFFNESAKLYLDAIIWFLANYDPDAEYYEGTMNIKGSKTDYVNKGKYCTFPHAIEMMALNYEKTFQILKFTKGLEAKISPFAKALENGAMEQLSGQVASAQIPLGKFVSPALYWVMTGDDFTLDINNPEEPKMVCMGNNPDRQTIYGTTLALYTARMFKLINHKHKLKSVVLLDELPTVFIKGLDNLIATARSNKVAIVLGAQDKSQLRRDYGDKEAEVIMTTVGNVFSGSVEGRTAEDISKAFGKQERKRVSRSLGEDSDSVSVSYQKEDILPASKIMDLTQGMFCGWVKDNFGQEIRMKKFCGAVQVDMERNKKLDKHFQGVPYITKLFGDSLPQMTEEDIIKFKKIYPELKDNSDKLYKMYLNDKVKNEIDLNFHKIKQEVAELVEKMVEKTQPFADEEARKLQAKNK